MAMRTKSIDAILQENISARKEKTLIDEVWVVPAGKFKSIVNDKFIRVFTVKQAQEFGVPYHPYPEWYKAQVGDYIETADGYVTVVGKRNNNPNFPYLATYFGTFALTPSMIRKHTDRGEVNTVLRERRTTISGDLIPKGTVMNKKQLDVALHCAGNIVTFGDGKYHETAEKVYGRPMSNVEVDKLVYSEKFQRAIVMNIKDLMKKADISETWAFEQAKNLVESENTPIGLKWEIIQEIWFQQGLVTVKALERTKTDLKVLLQQTNVQLSPVAGRINESFDELQSNN